jgi:hypothetical protein
MAYERSAIVETPNAPQHQAPAEMREERVINPYASRAARAAPAGPPVGQANTNETQPVAEPATPVETVRLSPQAAALARKELLFRQKEQKMSAELKAIEAERAEIAELKSLKQRLAADDYSGIEKLVNYEKYAQYLLNQQASADPQSQKLQAIESKLSEIEGTQKKDIELRHEAAIVQRKTAIAELLAKDETYSTVKALKREDAVLQHILDTWEHDNEELSVEQAAKEVEELLYERAQRMAQIPKLKKAEPAAPAPEEKKTLPPLRPGLKTLPNQATTTDIKRPLKPLSLMNESERYEEARRRALARLASQPPKPTIPQ